MRRLTVVGAGAVLLVLLCAGSAAADLYEGAIELQAPAQPPSFSPETPITRQGAYQHTVSVAYDETLGMLRIVSSFYEADYWAASERNSQLARQPFWLAASCNSASSEGATVTIQAAPREGAGEPLLDELTLSGTRGALKAAPVYGGGAYTLEFVSPLLARQTLRCLRFGPASGEQNPVSLTDVTQTQAEAAEALAFTPTTASAALRARLLSEHPSAVFPAGEGRVCPELYPDEVTGGKYSVCFAEFVTGPTWHIVSTSAHFVHGAVGFPEGLRDSRWRRRWVKCSLRGWHVPGVLSANNGCNRGPQTDAYFIAIEAYPEIRLHRRVRSVGWQFTESAGFGGDARFAAHKHGRTYTFTNAVGDSFRYTP